jgi:hypothetical protein
MTKIPYMPSIRDVHNATELILINKQDKALNYAYYYADTMLYTFSPHAVHVQAVYILNNITHWRRQPEAQYVRQVLRRYIEQNGHL